MDTVWGDTVISEAALTKAVARLRKALGDDSATHRYLETVRSQGYRFVAEVEEIGELLTGDQGGQFRYRAVRAGDLSAIRRDEVQVTGPFGATFLMPNDPAANIIMICTGTGSAPFRGFTEWRRRAMPGASGRIDWRARIAASSRSSSISAIYALLPAPRGQG